MVGFGAAQVAARLVGLCGVTAGIAREVDLLVGEVGARRSHVEIVVRRLHILRVEVDVPVLVRAELEVQADNRDDVVVVDLAAGERVCLPPVGTRSSHYAAVASRASRCPAR